MAVLSGIYDDNSIVDLWWLYCGIKLGISIWFTHIWRRFEDFFEAGTSDWEEMRKEKGEQQRRQSDADNICKIILLNRAFIQGEKL